MVVLLADVGDKAINRRCHSKRINNFLGCKGTNKRAKKQVLTGKACLPSQECLFTVSASTFMALHKGTNKRAKTTAPVLFCPLRYRYPVAAVG